MPLIGQSISNKTLRVWDTTDHGKNKVELSVFIPEDGETEHKTVIICPGGSYFWLDNRNEGEAMARSLCRYGFTAAVLTYRTAGKFNFITDLRALYGGNVYPAMYQDLRKSLEIISDRADEFRADRNAVGVMGFSAGGHLAMLAAENTCGHKPAFVAAVYPVVSMADKCAHHRSRRGLMGIRRGNKSLRDSLSIEKHVTESCCPVFLLSCTDDKVVDCRNSELLDSALTSKDVPHKYISLPEGGHGFGYLCAGSGENEFNWTEAFVEWVKGL